MNKIYKIVWSQAKQCYVVTSEYAKSRTKGCSGKKLLTMLIAAGVLASGVCGSASAAVKDLTVDGTKIGTYDDETGVVTLTEAIIGSSKKVSKDTLLEIYGKEVIGDPNKVSTNTLLEVYGKSTLMGDVTIGQPGADTNGKTLNRNLTVNGNETVTGNLILKGVINSNVVIGTASSTKNLTVNGKSTLLGDVTIGSASSTKNLKVTGNLTADKVYTNIISISNDRPNSATGGMIVGAYGSTISANPSYGNYNYIFGGFNNKIASKDSYVEHGTIINGSNNVINQPFSTIIGSDYVKMDRDKGEQADYSSAWHSTALGVCHGETGDTYGTLIGGKDIATGGRNATVIGSFGSANPYDSDDGATDKENRKYYDDYTVKANGDFSAIIGSSGSKLVTVPVSEVEIKDGNIYKDGVLVEGSVGRTENGKKNQSGYVTYEKFGGYVYADGDYAHIIGAEADNEYTVKAAGNYSTIIGAKADTQDVLAEGEFSTIVGSSNSNVKGNYGTVIGSENVTASGANSTIIGSKSKDNKAKTTSSTNEYGVKTDTTYTVDEKSGHLLKVKEVTYNGKIYSTTRTIAALKGSFTANEDGSYTYGQSVASGKNATVVGSEGSSATGDYSGVYGGIKNYAAGNYDIVLGGSGNIAYSNANNSIGNTVNKAYAAAVIGGHTNQVYADSAAIIAGNQNTIASIDATRNGAGEDSAILAGSFNVIAENTDEGAIVAGKSNTLNAWDSVIVGGLGNVINGNAAEKYKDAEKSSTISGGEYNTIWHVSYAGIVGGKDNLVYDKGESAFIAGGESNVASGQMSSVIGSNVTNATGSHSSVQGSTYSTASGDYSAVIASGPSVSYVEKRFSNTNNWEIRIKDGKLVYLAGADENNQPIYETIYENCVGYDRDASTGEVVATIVVGTNTTNTNVITASGEYSMVLNSCADVDGRIDANGDRATIVASRATGVDSKIYGTALMSEVKNGAKINNPTTETVNLGGIDISTTYEAQPSSIVAAANGTQYGEINNYGKSSVIIGVGVGEDTLSESDKGTEERHGKVLISGVENRSLQDSINKQEVEYATIIGSYADNKHTTTAQASHASIIGSANTNATAKHSSVVGSRNVDTSADYATTIGTVGHNMNRGTSYTTWDYDTVDTKIVNDSIGGVMIGVENRNPGANGIISSKTAGDTLVGGNPLQVSHGNVIIGALAYDNSKIKSEQVLVNDGRDYSVIIQDTNNGNSLYELSNGYSTMMGIVARDGSEITTDASNTTILGSMANYSGAIEVKDAANKYQNTRFASVLGSEASAGKLSLSGRSATAIGVTAKDKGNVNIEALNSTIIGSRADGNDTTFITSAININRKNYKVGFDTVIGSEASQGTINVYGRNATVIGSLAGIDVTKSNSKAGGKINQYSDFGTIIGVHAEKEVYNGGEFGTIIGSAAVGAVTKTFGDHSTIIGSTDSIAGFSNAFENKKTQFATVIGSSNVKTQASYSAIFASDPVEIAKDSDFSVIMGSKGVAKASSNDTNITGQEVSTYVNGKYNLISGSENVIINGEHGNILGSTGSMIGEEGTKGTPASWKFVPTGEIISESWYNSLNPMEQALCERVSAQPGKDAVAVNYGVILGSENSQVLGDHGVVIGGLNSSAITESVALGTGAVANTVAGAVGYDISGKMTDAEKDNATWTATKNAISVGYIDAKDDSKSVTRQITGVAAGTEDTDAVNVAQLKKAAAAAADDANLNFKGDYSSVEDGKNNINRKSGETLNIVGNVAANAKLSDGNIAVVSDDKDTLTLKLASDVNIDTLVINGKDGKDGKDGITIKGADGKDGIGLDGKDGITVYGKDGKDGKDGVSINGTDGISVKGENGEAGLNGKDGLTIYGKDGKDGADGKTYPAAVAINGKDGVDGVDGAEGHIGLNGKDGVTDIYTRPGVDGVDGKAGKDGITRIVYKDPKGTEHEVATTDDGMKYSGDTGDQLKMKLNENVNIVGGASDATKLTDNNIGVVADGKDTLTIKLNKDIDLGETGSVTTGDTVINNDGLVINNTDASKKISLTSKTINMGGQQIHNVAAGTKDTDVVNVSQLKQYSFAAKTEVKAGENVTVVETTDEDGDGHTIYTVNAKDTTYSIENKDGKVSLVNNLDKTDTTTIVEEGKGVTINNDGKIDVKVDGTTTSINSDNQVVANTVKNVTNVAGDGTTNVVNTYTINNQNGTVEGSIVDTNTTYSTELVYDAKDTDKVGEGASVTLTGNDGSVTNIITAGDGVVITKDANGNNVINVTIDTEESSQMLIDQGTNYKGDVVKEGTPDVDGEGHVNVPLGKLLTIKGEATEYSDNANVAVITDNTVDKQSMTIRLAKDINLGEDGSLTIGGTKIESNSVKAGDTTINNDGLTITGGPTITKTKVDVAGNKITNVAAGEDDTDAVNVSQLKELEQKIENNAGDMSAINNKVNNLGNRINKVGARAAALAALHPLDFDPDDKLNFAVGYGHYKGENAGAIGAFYRPDEKVMFSIAGTVAEHDTMINAGLSFSLDRTPRQTNTKTAMAREILDLREQVNELKSMVYKLANKNMDTEMFPDVPENHWAYEYVDGLQKAGIIEGYPDGNFSGDRSCTRYEFAAMLYRALKAGQVIPQKLADEFAPELCRFRVDRVSGADDKYHKVERIRVNGDRDFNRDAYGSKQAQKVTSRGPEDVYPNYQEVKKAK